VDFGEEVQGYFFFFTVLRLYTPDPDTLNELMGFKFKFYENEGGHVPQSLYQLTALLVQHGLLDLDVIWAMLKPDSDEAIAIEAEKEMIEAKEAFTIKKKKSTLFLIVASHFHPHVPL